MRVVKQSVEMLWITPEAEKQIELAGRTCYKSEGKITEDSAYDFVTKMIKSGHHAMIEHGSASFRIITDRGITHEIVRHRLASYAQESTRYCNYNKDKFDNQCSFIKPPGMNEAESNTWVKACESAELAYQSMLYFGSSSQIARSVLSNCLKTEIVMTANFREWRHFITLRVDKTAHPQIRPIAAEIFEILMKFAPSIFEDLDAIVNDK